MMNSVKRDPHAKKGMLSHHYHGLRLEGSGGVRNGGEAETPADGKTNFLYIRGGIQHAISNQELFHP